MLMGNCSMPPFFKPMKNWPATLIEFIHISVRPRKFVYFKRSLPLLKLSSPAQNWLSRINVNVKNEETWWILVKIDLDIWWYIKTAKIRKCKTFWDWFLNVNEEEEEWVHFWKNDLLASKLKWLILEHFYVHFLCCF